MADLQSQAGAAPPSSPDYKHRIRTASRLTPIDQDVQADACGRRRFTMGRGSGAEIFRFGVVGRFAGARHFEAGTCQMHRAAPAIRPCATRRVSPPVSFVGQYDLDAPPPWDPRASGRVVGAEHLAGDRLRGSPRPWSCHGCLCGSREALRTK